MLVDEIPFVDEQAIKDMVSGKQHCISTVMNFNLLVSNIMVKTWPGVHQKVCLVSSVFKFYHFCILHLPKNYLSLQLLIAFEW